MYWDDPEQHVGQERLAQFWLANDQIREAVNTIITGSPNRWPLEWFCDRFAATLPLGHAAVIGCGTGNLERDLLAKQIVECVTAVDIAGATVEYARTAAAEAGVAERIEYVVGDGVALLQQRPGTFDGIFFHGALHHFASVRHMLRTTREALRPNGLLYLDEYVGPSMHQWTWRRLVIPNAVYWFTVPVGFRRPKLVRAPRNSEDPTEMLDSASIVTEVYRQFRVLDERGYGGNILGLLYPNLRHDIMRSRPSSAAATVRRLLRIEQWLLLWTPHHHVILIAQRD